MDACPQPENARTADLSRYGGLTLDPGDAGCVKSWGCTTSADLPGSSRPIQPGAALVLPRCGGGPVGRASLECTVAVTRCWIRWTTSRPLWLSWSTTCRCRSPPGGRRQGLGAGDQRLRQSEPVDEGDVVAVPDVVLVVTAAFVVALISGEAAASLVLPLVVVDVVFAVVPVVAVVLVAVGVVLEGEGTAERKSTVTLTPLILALFDSDTTVVELADDDAGATVSNSV